MESKPLNNCPSKQDDGCSLSTQQILREEYCYIDQNTLCARTVSTHHCNNDDDSARQCSQCEGSTLDSLETLYTKIHKDNKRTALCISGGGIRSASFGLGVLQGLAKHIDIKDFHYLSTVSGGGYIGSWLSVWIHRVGMEKVQQQLEGVNTSVYSSNSEQDAISYLRRYSSYLSPRTGLFSLDIWALAGIYLRNLLLNWLVLLPLVLVLLQILWIWASFLYYVSCSSSSNSVFNYLGVSCFVALAVIMRFTSSSLTANSGHPLGSKTDENEAYLSRLTRIIKALLVNQCVVVISLLVPLVISILWFLQEKDLGLAFSTVKYPIVIVLLSAIFARIDVIVKYLFDWRKNRHKISDISQLLLKTLRIGLAIGAAVSFAWYAVCVMFQQAAYHQLNTMRMFNTLNMYKPFDSGYQLSGALVATIGPAIFILIFLLASTLYIGLASYDTSDADRELMARFGGLLLQISSVWLILSSLVYFAPLGIIWLWENFNLSFISLFAGTAVTSLLGWHRSSIKAGESPHSNLNVISKSAYLSRLVLNIGSVTLLLLILGTLALSLTYINDAVHSIISKYANQQQLPIFNIFSYRNSHVLSVLLIAGILVLFSFIISQFVNVNKYSLHGAYRNRLIRAFLGGASEVAGERRPNNFTEMDDHDNLQMHELIKPVYEDIRDLAKLVNALRDHDGHSLNNHADKIHIIRRKLSPATRRLIEEYKTETADQPYELKTKLIADFNRILHGEPLNLYQPFTNDADENLKKLVDSQPVFKHFNFKYKIVQKLTARKVYVDSIDINRLIINSLFGNEIFKLTDNSNNKAPFHIINMALNLVRVDNLAWRDRKAQSFTASPLHVGSWQKLGYRKSRQYGINPPQNRAITIGTSMAISGAVASPNMGYHSSPFLTSLMTLLNIRLGWWSGNPGEAGNDTFMRSCPRYAPQPLIAEFLGLSNNRSSYIYLTDGGHFENLGLYEMVLRRCKYIVVVDSSQDEKFDFDSLGNAVNKIRIDMGIPIVFDAVPITRRKKVLTRQDTNQLKANQQYCAVATIKYSVVDKCEGLNDSQIDGKLIYIKPSVYGNEPLDVYKYALANPTFPHESTADQVYSENQFESYRELGAYAVNQILGGISGNKISIKQLWDYACLHTGALSDTPVDNNPSGSD